MRLDAGQTLNLEITDLTDHVARLSVLLQLERDLNSKLSLSNDVKKAALIRLREWDMLDACGDGPWAKRLIDDALK